VASAPREAAAEFFSANKLRLTAWKTSKLRVLLGRTRGERGKVDLLDHKDLEISSPMPLFSGGQRGAQNHPHIGPECRGPSLSQRAQGATPSIHTYACKKDGNQVTSKEEGHRQGQVRRGGRRRRGALQGSRPSTAAISIVQANKMDHGLHKCSVREGDEGLLSKHFTKMIWHLQIL
jgi:hypothetical protein